MFKADRARTEAPGEILPRWLLVSRVEHPAPPRRRIKNDRQMADHWKADIRLRVPHRERHVRMLQCVRTNRKRTGKLATKNLLLAKCRLRGADDFSRRFERHLVDEVPSQDEL